MILKEWLQEAPFSLAMSSGFFGFFAHCGFISALEDAGLMPQRMHGSSAGALIAGLWASGLSAYEIRDVLFELKRKDFWDPGIGAGLLRGKAFDRILRCYLRAEKIENCRIPLNITAFDVVRRKTISLRSGCLPTALRASCAVPLLFHPVRMHGRVLLDGGIADRPGLNGADANERILYHHLVPSRWWRPESPKCRPQGANITGVEIRGLPRLGPYRLSAGKEAFQRARLAAEQLLQSTLSPFMSLSAHDVIQSRSQPGHGPNPSRLS